MKKLHLKKLTAFVFYFAMVHLKDCFKIETNKKVVPLTLMTKAEIFAYLKKKLFVKKKIKFVGYSNLAKALLYSTWCLYQTSLFQSNMDVLAEVLRMQQESNSSPSRRDTSIWPRLVIISSINLLFFFSILRKLSTPFLKSFKILLYNEELAEELVEKTAVKKLSRSWPFIKNQLLKNSKI